MSKDNFGDLYSKCNYGCPNLFHFCYKNCIELKKKSVTKYKHEYTFMSKDTNILKCTKLKGFA